MKIKTCLTWDLNFSHCFPFFLFYSNLQVTDRSVRAVAEHCPELQFVGFMGCPVTSQGVIHLTAVSLNLLYSSFPLQPSAVTYCQNSSHMFTSDKSAVKRRLITVSGFTFLK